MGRGGEKRGLACPLKERIFKLCDDTTYNSSQTGTQTSFDRDISMQPVAKDLLRVKKLLQSAQSTVPSQSASALIPSLLARLAKQLQKPTC